MFVCTAALKQIAEWLFLPSSSQGIAPLYRQHGSSAVSSGRSFGKSRLAAMDALFDRRSANVATCRNTHHNSK